MKEYPDELRDELRAVANARKEVSADEEEYLIDAFLARLDRELDARIEARIAAQMRTRPRRRPTTRADDLAFSIALLAAPIPVAYLVSHLLYGVYYYEWSGAFWVLLVTMWTILAAISATWRIAERHFTRVPGPHRRG